MITHQLTDSAKRALRLCCRQGGGAVGNSRVPTEDLAALTAAGLLVEVLGGWKATEASCALGLSYDRRAGVPLTYSVPLPLSHIALA